MYQSEFCEVSYNEELNVVFLRLKKFCCGNDYREPLLYAIEIMKAHEGCNFVADTRDGFEDEPEDAQWIINEFIPRTAETSCKIIFFIISQDNNLKEELEGHSVELRKHFEVISCFSLDEVKEILTKKVS